MHILFDDSSHPLHVSDLKSEEVKCDYPPRLTNWLLSFLPGCRLAGCLVPFVVTEDVSRVWQSSLTNLPLKGNWCLFRCLYRRLSPHSVSLMPWRQQYQWSVSEFILVTKNHFKLKVWLLLQIFLVYKKKYLTIFWFKHIYHSWNCCNHMGLTDISDVRFLVLYP